VVTTIDSRAAADALAQGAVRARLAACAQVSGPIDSSYWWEGSVTTDQEWQVAFKTTATGYEALARHLAEEHPYDVPEILCFPVVAGHRPYLDWLDTEVTAPG
jgi:periplasmic divalent cation tolerance protein